MQSFLVGQPELRTMMQGPHMQQLRQRVIASYHLGPMDRAETQAYIEHRLAHVGWKGDPSFEAGALDLIHRASDGVPRRINTICNRLLLAGFLGEKHSFGESDVEGIVREIREELGPETTLASVPLDERMPAQRQMPSGEDALGWLGHFKAIEERLDKLEMRVGSALRLLQRLLEPDRVNKPRSPAGR
jgi:hypothetical protein